MQQEINGFKRPTLRESLTKIAGLLAGGRKANLYTAPCALGVLMTKEQREDLKAHGLNSKAIHSPDFLDYVHKDNIEFVTGMTFEQARVVQDHHDSGGYRFGALRTAIQNILREGKGSIGGVPFVLEPE